MKLIGDARFICKGQGGHMSYICTCHILSICDIYDVIDHARLKIEFTSSAKRHTCVCKRLVLELIAARHSEDAVFLATG